jgi:DNA-directed RNA polymerase subunit M/transcription elongation factor TFIIS
MHFCSVCHNMYYLKIVEDEEGNDNTTLAYYCRNCGNSDTMLMTENNCVSNTQIKRTEQNYNHIINEYTKHDPTLPRISTINCPNPACESNTVEELASEAGSGASEAAEEGTSSSEMAKKPEIIYIRYDDVNMKYIYLCTYCDTKWKTNESK